MMKKVISYYDKQLKNSICGYGLFAGFVIKIKTPLCKYCGTVQWVDRKKGDVSVLVKGKSNPFTIINIIELKNKPKCFVKVVEYKSCNSLFTRERIKSLYAIMHTREKFFFWYNRFSILSHCERMLRIKQKLNISTKKYMELFDSVKDKRKLGIWQ